MSGFRTILLPASDLAASRDFYQVMVGAAPFMDQSYYVAFQCGEVQLGLNPHGTPGPTGPLVYWDSTDAAALKAQLVAAGGTVRDDLHDVGGGKLVATIEDPAGNVIGLQQEPQ